MSTQWNPRPHKKYYSKSLVLAGFIVYCAVLSNTSGWRTVEDIGLDRVMVLTAQVGADGAGGWHFLFFLNGMFFTPTGALWEAILMQIWPQQVSVGLSMSQYVWAFAISVLCHIEGVENASSCSSMFWLIFTAWEVITFARHWILKNKPSHCVFKIILDLESIGSSLGIDWEIIWTGVEWSGPAIRPGLDNRHLIILTPHTCL